MTLFFQSDRSLSDDYKEEIMKKLFLLAILLFASFSFAETIGSVDTKWKMFGENNKLVVEVFDDPLVKGISCYISRPVKGGIGGAIGTAEETSDSSLSCRQTGPITDQDIGKLQNFEKNGRDKEGKENISYRSVFKTATNLFFKNTWVVRFYDSKRNVVVYMSFARELIDGSPKSSISVVPIN